MEKTLYIFYRILIMSGFGKILLGKTEFEVNRYLPFDSYGTGVRTMGVFLRNFMRALLFFWLAFILFAQGNFKYFGIAIIVSVAAYYDSFVSWKRKQEITILKQLSLFIGELRRSYYRREDVIEAFSEAFHLAGEELKLHLGLIEEAFEYGGVPERYRAASPSKFLLVLLSICQCTIRYGDKDMIFISNLDELQKNIDSDLLKWDRENFIYQSLFLVMVIPLLSLPVMERWAISQIGDLYAWYHDFRGSLVRIGILFLSFPVFLFFFKTKDTGHRGINPFLDFLLEIPMINQGLRGIFEWKKNKEGGVSKLIAGYFPGYSYTQFLMLRGLCFLISFFFMIYWLWYWRKSGYFIVLAFILSIGFSFLPYLSLVIQGLYYESELEDEISQVRLMMISLSTVSGITAEEILLWVESFTTYLKASISECIDKLGSDEEAAFYHLRNQWRNTSFIVIVDDLIASDKIGIQEAFRDLLSRREYYLARRRQDREFISRKKEAVLSAFMYLPLMSSVFLYLIIPFLIYSFTNLLEIINHFS